MPTFSKSLAKKWAAKCCFALSWLLSQKTEEAKVQWLRQMGRNSSPALRLPACESTLWVIPRWCWVCCEAHLEESVEPGEGWLLSEALFPGELWSLSPWLLQWLASSSNSCPDIILSISSSDIFDKALIYVRLSAQDTPCSFFRTENLLKLHGDS